MPSLHPSDYVANDFTSTGELEDVFTGQSQGHEVQPLLNNEHKYFTVVPKPFMLFGAYNKINYTAVCYNDCLMANNEQEPKTKSLLCFGGGFSKTGSNLAFVLLLVFFVLPFAAVWPFFVEPQTRTYKALLLFTGCMEFLLFLWHFYCIYIIKVKNLKVWLNSWFTFCVKSEKLRDDETTVKAHSFFYLSGKLRVLDVSVSDLCRLNSGLHQLTATQRDNLAHVVEKHRREQAAIILYSEEFISKYMMCSLYGISVLVILSAASTTVLAWKASKIWMQ